MTSLPWSMSSKQHSARERPRLRSRSASLSFYKAPNDLSDPQANVRFPPIPVIGWLRPEVADIRKTNPFAYVMKRCSVRNWSC